MFLGTIRLYKVELGVSGFAVQQRGLERAPVRSDIPGQSRNETCGGCLRERKKSRPACRADGGNSRWRLGSLGTTTFIVSEFGSFGSSPRESLSGRKSQRETPLVAGTVTSMLEPLGGTADFFSESSDGGPSGGCVVGACVTGRNDVAEGTAEKPPPRWAAV